MSPSVFKIKDSIKAPYKFEFRKVAIDDVGIHIRKLNPKGLPKPTIYLLEF